MGYFSNGSESEMYARQYCARCVNWQDGACPVFGLHFLHNYDQFPRSPKSDVERAVAKVHKEYLSTSHC